MLFGTFPQSKVLLLVQQPRNFPFTFESKDQAMNLFNSTAILNQAAIENLPEGMLKGLWVRFTGTNLGGQAVTLANLGVLKVQWRAKDIINVPVSFISAFNNLHYGVAKFASAVGGAFEILIYVPFHVYWNQDNGLKVVKGDGAFVDIRTQALAAIVATGLIEVYYERSTSTAKYIPMLIQQNIQVGGAGQVPETVKGFNISSLYFTENASITNINLHKDGTKYVSSNQQVLGDASSLRNRLETDITTFEIDLNPDKVIANAMVNVVDLELTATGATAYEMFYMAILFLTQQVIRQPISTGGTGITPTPVGGGAVPVEVIPIPPRVLNSAS